MKKLLSLILALTLVFSFCCIFASAEEGEPEAYLWLKADESFTPGIQFSIPGDKLVDADYRIITDVCFEGCEGEGTAYVNYYVYSKDATGTGDFEHLIQFCDFANHKSAGEGWTELEFTFNPTDNLYGKLEGEKITDIGFVTIGIGFWQATGTVKCSSVRLNKDLEVVWSKGFGAGLDLDDESIAYADLGTEGVNWGVVRPVAEDNGNIAKAAVEVTATGTSSTYNAPLNDGAAASAKSYTNDWFAFTRDVSPLADFEGKESYIGTAIFDFGEPVYWNAARVNIWDAAGDSGIASPVAIVVSYSDDKETWTEAGRIPLGAAGTVYWTENTFDTVSSQYVKFEFPWTNGSGAFVFINEIEIIGCDAPIEENFDGDVNKDGVVNSRDAIYLLRALLNPDKYPIDFSGDLNGDGTANTADAVYLLRHVFFPEDYPLVTEPIEPTPVPAEGENIAEGKSYTVDEGYTVRDDGYGDPDFKKLTDGVKDTTGGSAPAGFNGTDASVIIDLGGKGTIDGIIADIQGNNWGIPEPFGYTVNFAVSLDGEEWADLGAGYMQKVLEQETGWEVADFFVNCDGIEARYVKVNYVTPADYTGNHIWPSEIQVIGTLEEEPEPAELPIYVVGDEGIAEVTDEALAKLLDGVYASDATAFSDARLMNINWDAAFNYSTPDENGTKKATIFYNLDEALNVTGIKLGAFKDRNSFVDLPGVKIYLTTDGETYVRAADGTWTSEIDGLANATEERTGTPVGEAIYFADWSTRAAYSVKGIMIELELADPFAFLSEIEIVTDYVADGALEENIGHAVDTVKLNGVDVAIVDAIANVITAKSGEMPLDATATGDFRLARSGVITIAKWDDAVKGYRVTFNEANGWPNNREGSMPAAANDEIYVFTLSSGTIKNAGAGDKWTMWHIEVGDVLYVYDDVIAINHMIDEKESNCFVEKEKTIDDIDTTDWTYVDGVETGLWQNDSDPVGTYYYNAGNVDGQYVIEILFNGELSGTNESYGNGNGTNVRIWFHTAKNEAGNPQATYNSFIDVAYTPDAVLNRFMVNTSETGNSASAKYGYTDEKPYTVEYLLSEDLDAMYVKIVLDEVPNCIIEEDLDAILTVSNKPEGFSNNALYSGAFKTPYSGWERTEAYNFYEIPAEPEREVADPTGYNYALTASMELVGAAVTGDPLDAGYGSYKSSLNDGVAAEEQEYDNRWFGYYYSASALDKSNAFAGTSNDAAGNIGSVVIDLGSEMTWNQVRLHTWAANASGIGAPIAINVFSSTDGETWTYVADMVLGEAGTVYWASTDTEFPDVTSQFVKVDFVWTNGVFGFANEIEVYGDEEPVVPEEPDPVQPEEKVELPEDAIVIEFAGYKHAANVSIVAGDGETVAELTARGNNGAAKDMNYAYNILVDKDNKVIDVDFALGTACDFTCPEGGYIITYNGNKEGYAAMADIKVGAEITLYNINLAPIAELEGNVELTSAGFTYANPIQPAEKVELPEGAIVIEFAGYKHAANVSIVAGDGETVAELTARGNNGTAKDMNYAYNILVDKDNKVIGVDFALGTACTFTCPEGGYIISYNGNKEGYTAMADIKVGDVITLYNINVDPIADLEGNVELTSAGFTFETVIDVDTTGWTYVDGEKTGAWQNTSDPVGSYWYNVGIEDGKYVLEVVFDGELTGTADSHGNGNGTNIRIWFHTAKNAAGTRQLTYNSFIDVEYTPDEILSRFMVNTLTDGNKAAAEYAYDAEKPYVLETIVPTALDGLYVKLVFDSIPNCVDNEDLDCVFTVSSKPESGNNALYSSDFLKPYAGTWDRLNSVNFYEVEIENLALDADITVNVDSTTYNAVLNDGDAYDAGAYDGRWFGFTRTSSPIETFEEQECYVGKLVYDFGEAVTWNTVRANMWENAGAGIDTPVAIIVYSSDDNETWTKVGYLKLGKAPVYWAEETFEDVTSRYVKVEFGWTKAGGKAFIMTNEVQVGTLVDTFVETPEAPAVVVG